MGKLRVSLRLGKRGWSFDRKFSIFYQWPFWLTFFFSQRTNEVLRAACSNCVILFWLHGSKMGIQ